MGKQDKEMSVRRCAVIAIAAVMVVLALGIIILLVDRVRKPEQQSPAESVVNAEETEKAEEKEAATLPKAIKKKAYTPPVDFEELLKQNQDTIGWIRIPDTKIDYPIVQGKDNEKYLHMDFQGNRSVYGTIFLDCDSDQDFLGRNHVLYGHHMKDGSMFKDVVKFKDQEFFETHRYFDIYTPKRDIRLKTLACYYSSSDGIVRKTQFESQDEFDAWVNDRLAPCSFAETVSARLPAVYVLVTCSYEMADARTLLFAAEVNANGQIISRDDLDMGTTLSEKLRK